MKRRNGFTLIEIMIVVVIIGILSALAIPRFTKASMRSKISEARLILRSIYQAAMIYYQENGCYPGTNWGTWFFNNAKTKNTSWNELPGFDLDRPSGYPRFTYSLWTWTDPTTKKSFFHAARAWGWSPDSYDAQVRKVKDLQIDKDGIITGGTIMGE